MRVEDISLDLRKGPLPFHLPGYLYSLLSHRGTQASTRAAGARGGGVWNVSPPGTCVGPRPRPLLSYYPPVAHPSECQTVKSGGRTEPVACLTCCCCDIIRDTGQRAKHVQPVRRRGQAREVCTGRGHLVHNSNTSWRVVQLTAIMIHNRIQRITKQPHDALFRTYYALVLSATPVPGGCPDTPNTRISRELVPLFTAWTNLDALHESRGLARHC